MAAAFPFGKNKNPTAGLAMGFLKICRNNQNPTATRPSSVVSSSSRLFKLPVTPQS